MYSGLLLSENIAAVLCVNADLSEQALSKAVYAPMPICLVNCTDKARDYFIEANSADIVNKNEYRAIYKNKENPLQSVVVDTVNKELSSDLMEKVWNKMFRKVRRTNTGAHGDCQPRMDISEAGFEIYIDDARLDEQEKKPHTWFTHLPSYVKKTQDKKVPLLMFFHGGSDNPAEAAEMSKFHERGEKEGFITVYPWGTNKHPGIQIWQRMKRMM